MTGTECLLRVGRVPMQDEKAWAGVVLWRQGRRQGLGDCTCVFYHQIHLIVQSSGTINLAITICCLRWLFLSVNLAQLLKH